MITELYNETLTQDSGVHKFDTSPLDVSSNKKGILVYLGALNWSHPDDAIIEFKILGYNTVTQTWYIVFYKHISKWVTGGWYFIDNVPNNISFYAILDVDDSSVSNATAQFRSYLEII